MTPLRPDSAEAAAAAETRRPLWIAAVLSVLLHGGGFLAFAVLHETRPPEPPQVLSLVFVKAGDLPGTPAQAASGKAADPQRQAMERSGEVQSTASVFSPSQSSSSVPITKATAPEPLAPQKTIAEVARPEEKVHPSDTQAEAPAPGKLAWKPPAPRRKPSLPKPSEKIASQAPREREIDEEQAPESLAMANENPLFEQPSADELLAETLDEKLAVPGVQAAALSSGAGFDTVRPGAAATATAARYSGGGLSNSQPRYPYSSRRRGEEGRVVLRVQVTAEGAAAKVSVLSSSGFRRLDRAALKAVKTWRFLPASRNGKNLPGTVDVPVTFNLTDG